MSRSRAALTCLVALAASPGCSSTGVGNPLTSELAVVSDDAPEVDAVDPTETLDATAVTAATLVVRAMSWVPCDATVARRWAPGPFRIDLQRGVVEPALPPLQIDDGQRICGLDARLGPALSPGALLGRSLHFAGKRSDGTPFVLLIDLPGTLRVRTSDPAGFAATDVPRLLWALRPRRWLTPNELTAAAPADAAIIVVDSEHPLLLEIIKRRLAGRSTLHVDTNGNGQLDPDERPKVIGRGLDTLDAAD